MPYDDELIDCKSHKVYPNLCVTHFEEDHQDHALIKCDVGLKESNLEFARKVLDLKEMEYEKFLEDYYEFKEEIPIECDTHGQNMYILKSFIEQLRLRAEEMWKGKG